MAFKEDKDIKEYTHCPYYNADKLRATCNYCEYIDIRNFNKRYKELGEKKLKRSDLPKFTP